MAINSVVSNFSTTLAQSMTSTQGTMVLTSATVQGHLLTPADYGTVLYFTINPGASNCEIVRASTNTGTTFTLDKRGLAWYGPGDTELASYKYAHNAGEVVIISDAKNVFDNLVDNVSDETIGGVKTFTSSPIVPDPTTAMQAANKEYVDGVAIAGAPNASTTVKGIVQAATQAQTDARTTTGSTGALLFPTLDVIRATKYSDYAVDSVGTDSYAITVTPAITAYAAGQVFVFKAGTANTGAATLNVSGLGAKTIKKDVTSDLATGDILANQDVMVVYDGTNFQLLSGLANLGQKIQNSEYVYAADSVGTDAYAVTLVPAPSAYAAGQRFVFKAGTANTDAATLNVNSLGAKNIYKGSDQALETGDIKSGQIVEVVYDGTEFQMVSQVAAPITYKVGSATRAGNTATGTQTIAHGLGRVPKMTRISVSYGAAGMAASAQSQGAYNGTTNACTYGYWRTNSTATTTGSSSSAVAVVGDALNSGTQTATATVDATNITLSWTSSGTMDSSNMQIFWEVEG